MSIIKRLLTLMLAAVMALTLAGCADTAWVMKANDTVIDAGIYIYYQTQGYVDAVYQLAEQDENYYYYYLYGYSLLEDELNDKPVSEHVNDFAMDMCRQYVVVDTLYNQLGLTLTEDDLAVIDNEVRQAWEKSHEYLETIGVSKSSLEKVIASKYKEERVFDAYYEIGGIKGTTEEMINSYVEDEYARVKFIKFDFADSPDDAIDAARKDEMLALANSYMERADNGEDFDTLIDEYEATLPENEENVEVEEEEPEYEDEETAALAEKYRNEYILGLDSTVPSPKFVKYVFSNCKVGEISVIQDDISFFVVQRLNVLEREDIMEASRDFIIKEIYDSDYTALINTTLSGYTITVNDKAIKRYTAKNAIFGPNDEGKKA